MLVAELAELLHFQPFFDSLLIPTGVIVDVLAIRAFHFYQIVLRHMFALRNNFESMGVQVADTHTSTKRSTCMKTGI